jgi:hypothetical protein
VGYGGAVPSPRPNKRWLYGDESIFDKIWRWTTPRNTRLLVAASNEGNLCVMLRLIRKGADVNTTDRLVSLASNAQFAVN